MKTNTKKYLAQPDGKFLLKDFSTTYDGHLDKENGKLELEKVKKELDEYQEKLYASGSHSILIIFQAMDAAGKDSAIEHVMSGLNPQGCQVFSFKAPSSEEYKHDFLWRHYKALPEKGRVGIHNRSHYENVLVCKVHPEYVLSENIPGYTDVKKIDQKFWKNRYENIRNFEKQLTDNGTVVIKFFLHVSKEEQKQRFLDRINDPAKNWKFAAGDLKERALWKNYMQAYEEAIQETSTKNAPWHVIPADKKWYARLAISQIVSETFEELNLKYPTLPKVELAQLETLKQQLLNEK
ncbi:polyphosphate kinase 2 family protein [Pedobacter sp. LMG 31464]|uniref:Polyphosphate kinase 2 family protein n=1 Tax=Pedobacter planticolens TaxID=2679964 RepID=A0A923IW46_9SPHI|nr:polyphosphate kinase 2 family protein [Pedobacter planticolens]MBB2144777.1 polyphosphate kinase 2 family protein [Pedobacter planticolens]